MFTLLAAFIACDLVEQVSQYFLGPEFAWLSQAGVFLELLFSVAVLPTFTAYLVRCAAEDWHESPLFRCALAVYAAYVAVLVLADQMDAHVRQREAAARQRAQVMALQMRPHLIYNVMTSIYYLCAQDPARAQQVTLDFTDYLRANFDAVVQEDTVPFAKELEHARAYLAVERARLEDALVVDIDCPHTAFRLPPLTLQPLVENAVKHGSDPELPPLHVSIATYEEPGFSVITVDDTGPGYENSLSAGASTSEAAKPAPALDNIRERLSACGATLEIAPRREGGTVAIIRIPSR